MAIAATNKIWGLTEALLVLPTVELHRIHAKDGYHCSWHRHQHKHNLFYVVTGELVVQVAGSEQGLHVWEDHRLLPGDHMTVPPGVLHRFMTVGSEAVALEVYYLQPLGEDILRLDEGGPNTDFEEAG